jgi:plastocyanin
MSERSAIHLKVEIPGERRRAKRVPIKAWQSHFWSKPIVNVPTHRHSNPRRHTNLIKNTKNLNPGNRLLHCTLCSLAVAVLNWSLPARGANTKINIVNFAFSPNTATINVNDTVTWTWVGSPHSSTSDTGLWDSGVFSAGHTFTLAFTSAGSFPFHCTVHPFMTGTITVQSANIPPTVALTSPGNGLVFAAPASFTLNAKASDSDGSVTNVQFLQGASVLGNSITPPYAASVSNLLAGTYTFSAVATDDGGSQSADTISLNVVTPGPLMLSAPQWLAPSSFQFSYSATIGLSYVVQRSLDLTQWAALSTNTATASEVVYTDQNASGNLWFYRVGLLPNP